MPPVAVSTHGDATYHHWSYPMIRKTLFSAALAAVALAAIPLAHAADEVNVSAGLVESGKPLAAHGYDVVSYFTDGKPQAGSFQYRETYQGATYRFASEAHQKAFRADPAKYAPQYGGFCAYGVSVGKKFDGDPQNWTLDDGKLYLNLNADIQDKFRKDVPGNVAKAEKNWKSIEHTAVSGL